MLVLVERSMFNVQSPNRCEPRIAGLSLFEAITKIYQEGLEVRCLDRALLAFFRRVLDIVQVFDHLARELQDGDNAGSDTERIHFAKASYVYGDRSGASASNVV